MAKTLNGATFLALLAATTAMPALAQQAPATDPQANSVVPDGDIIVTAQRRSESLQRVPVAVSVVTAEILAKRNVTTESDLQFTTPGLQVRTGSSATQVNFAVRGQSFDQFSGTRPGVLPYFNEVQASSSIGGGGGTTAFYDLDSVQLLKGPQGTLFGRNATGGAVLFTTAKPKDDFGGYVAARIGNYSTEQFEGALNLPIIADTLLARVAGFYSDNRGYQTNLTDGSHPGSETRYGVRGSVTFKTGSFTNDLVVDYYHSNGSSVTAVLYSVNPAGTASTFFSPTIDSVFGAPGFFAGYVAAKNDRNIDPAGIVSYLNNRQKPRGPYTIASDSANVYRARNIVITNASTLELNDNLKLRNIMGYSRFKSILANDSDGSPYGVAGSSYYNPAAATPYTKSGPYFDQNGVSKQFSEELQVQGKADALDYTLGFFYSNERATVLRPSEFLDIFRLAGMPQITYSNDASRHRTLAGYGQGTYQLGDVTGIQGLAVTLGLRYTSEKITAITLPRDSVYGLAIAQPTLYSNFQQRTINNLSWNFGLQNQVNSNLLIYANTRRSYKNGGFNSDQAPRNGYADVVGNSYRTETLTDVELGAKYQGRMGEVPVRLNLALFHDWIENSQRTAFALVANNPAAITVNVPRAKVYGMELDGSVSPASWLNVGGSLNYIHARFTSQQAFLNGALSRFATYPDTPEWSGSIYAEATAPISGSISATLRGDYYAQSKTFYSSSAQNNPDAVLPGYGVANFRIGLQNDAVGWSLSALLKNAFKKTYYTGGIPLGELLGFNTAIPGAPRSFIVEGRFKF